MNDKPLRIDWDCDPDDPELPHKLWCNDEDDIWVSSDLVEVQK